MKQLKSVRPSFSIDMQNHVIALHKITLSLIGSPEYIQILVNPIARTIIICGSDGRDYLAHRVAARRNNFRLYSKSLTQNLMSLCRAQPEDGTLRFYGEYYPQYNIAKFDI